MSDFKNVNNNDFMIEKIKEMPVNRRKLVRRTIITAFLAMMFGLIACLTFLLLEPVISNKLYPEEEAEIIVFPEDNDEMGPEDMLEDEPEVIPDPLPTLPPVNPQLDQEQVNEILDSVTLDKSHYVQLYNVMNDYAKELSSYMVTVTIVMSDYDWLSNIYEKETDTCGVVIARNNKYIFILTDESSVRLSNIIKVKFYNGTVKDATVIGKNKEINMAVLAISLEDFETEEEIAQIPIPVLGSSKTSILKGQPVVVMGSPMGGVGTTAYGMISAIKEDVVFTDFNYDYLITDIYGSQSAKGVIFNMSGKIVGIVTNTNKSADMRNIITAIGISDLKTLISVISSGNQIPYLGIEGIDVIQEENEEILIPKGTYVINVANNSPAMYVGIQQGDIIVNMNDNEIEDYFDYKKALYSQKIGETIKIKVMRFSQGEYKEMEMETVLKGAE